MSNQTVKFILNKFYLKFISKSNYRIEPAMKKQGACSNFLSFLIRFFGFFSAEGFTCFRSVSRQRKKWTSELLKSKLISVPLLIEIPTP